MSDAIDDLSRELTAEIEAHRVTRQKLAEERDCGQDFLCAIGPGCQRHWLQRNRELAAERDAAVKKLAELEEINREHADAIVSLTCDVANTESKRMHAEAKLAELVREVRDWVYDPDACAREDYDGLVSILDKYGPKPEGGS